MLCVTGISPIYLIDFAFYVPVILSVDTIIFDEIKKKQHKFSRRAEKQHAKNS
jgi:hypothetical protein